MPKQYYVVHGQYQVLQQSFVGCTPKQPTLCSHRLKVRTLPFQGRNVGFKSHWLYHTKAHYLPLNEYMRRCPRQYPSAGNWIATSISSVLQYGTNNFNRQLVVTSDAAIYRTLPGSFERLAEAPAATPHLLRRTEISITGSAISTFSQYHTGG